MTVSMDKKYVTRNGEYDAKVVSIHDADCYQKGELPVSAELKHKLSGKVITIQYAFNGQFSFLYNTHPLDLIEVPENTQDGWVNFDAENDEVPFLHMHDMVEVKLGNGHQSLPIPIPAWSVNFDSSRYPVVAYRLVKKAEQPEKKYPQIEALTLEDYLAAFDKGWDSKRFWSKALGTGDQTKELLFRAGIKAVLELAGVEV